MVLHRSLAHPKGFVIALLLVIMLLLAAGRASAGPPEATPPEPPVQAGFSLERSAWVSTPKVGEFGIGLLTAMSYRATFVDNEPSALGFYLPWVRPNFHATLFSGKLRVFIQPELAGPAPALLDAEIIYQPHEAFGIDLGQQRARFSRSWLTPVPIWAMPSLGRVNEEFRVGRELGVSLFGRPFGGRFEYDLGIYNAGGINLKGPIELQPLVTARLAVNPIGAVPYAQTPAFANVTKPVFGLAVNAWTDRFRPEPVGDPADPATVIPPVRERVALGGELVFMSPRVHLLAEGYGRWHLLRDRQLLDRGWGSQLQLGVMILDETLELHGRAGVFDPSRDEPLQGVWEGGMAWYLWGHHIKALLSYSCTQGLQPASRGCSNQFAQLQAQLWF